MVSPPNTLYAIRKRRCEAHLPCHSRKGPRYLSHSQPLGRVCFLITPRCNQDTRSCALALVECLFVLLR